ncbi:MAG: hypothetical protein ACREL5_14000 [Gemmatimonadales bacterium]
MTYNGAEIELRPGDGLGQFMTFISGGDASQVRKLFMPPNPDDARWTPRGGDAARPEPPDQTR